MCIAYILFSKQLNLYYVGHTCETMDERLRKHRSDHKGFTSRSKDWEVAHIEHFNDKSSAYKRELEIKRWKNRKKIEDLIAKG